MTALRDCRKQFLFNNQHYRIQFHKIPDVPVTLHITVGSTRTNSHFLTLSQLTIFPTAVSKQLTWFKIRLSRLVVTMSQSCTAEEQDSTETWDSRVHPSRHIIRHFGDESFYAIDWRPNSQKPRENTVKSTQQETWTFYRKEFFRFPKHTHTAWTH